MSTPQKVQVFSLGVPAKGTPTPEGRDQVKWRIDGRRADLQPDRLTGQLLEAGTAAWVADVGQDVEIAGIGPPRRLLRPTEEHLIHDDPELLRLLVRHPADPEARPELVQR